MSENLRELDFQVAERVMGWQRQLSYNYWMTFNDGTFQLHGHIASWKPSEDIKAAMEVVDKMREQGCSFACTLYVGKLPYASFCRGTVKSSRNAEASSLQEAICRAALAYVDAMDHPARELLVELDGEGE